MSSKMPHRHVCGECGTLITSECECPDKRVFAELCDKCHDVETELERELEF